MGMSCFPPTFHPCFQPEFLIALGLQNGALFSPLSLELGTFHRDFPPPQPYPLGKVLSLLWASCSLGRFISFFGENNLNSQQYCGALWGQVQFLNCKDLWSLTTREVVTEVSRPGQLRPVEETCTRGSNERGLGASMSTANAGGIGGIFGWSSTELTWCHLQTMFYPFSN